MYTSCLSCLLYTSDYVVNIFTMHINRNLKKEEFNVFASMIKEEKQVALKKYYFYEDAQRSLLGDVLVR